MKQARPTARKRTSEAQDPHPQRRASVKRAQADPDHPDPERHAWSAALAMLARREMAAEQVRRALLAKGHPDAAVEAALERLRRERYIDDDSLAARYALSRMEFGKQGQHRIRQGL